MDWGCIRLLQGYSCLIWIRHGGPWRKQKLNDPRLSTLKSGRISHSHLTRFGGCWSGCRIKEGLRRTFAEKANEFSLLLDTISLSIKKFEGALEVSLNPFFKQADVRINMNKSVKSNAAFHRLKPSYFTYKNLIHDVRRLILRRTITRCIPLMILNTRLTSLNLLLTRNSISFRTR